VSKGSGIGGCLHGAVTLALAAGLGYNAYQVIQLRSEVETLKKARSQRPAASVGQSLPLLQQARRHAERGQQLLKQKKVVEAQQELALAAQLTQQATGAAGSGRIAPQDIEKLVGSLSQKAGALWEQEKEGKQR
jgi:hypothetical protein